MEELDPNKLLPSDMVVERVDDILYDIGLSLTSVRELQKKRKFIHNPLLLLIVNTFMLVNKVACLFIDDSNEIVLKMLGEPGHNFGIKNAYCTMCILVTIIMLFSQWVYYNNYKHGIEPSFLKVFRMISSSVTPSSVGLNSESEVKDLMRNLKITVKLVKINNNVIGNISSFLFFTTAPLVNVENLNIIFISFPMIILNTIWAYYIFNIIFYQILYFFILCRYLRIKLQNLNESINKIKIESNKSKFARISKHLHLFNALNREINEYNVTYWSKFLFIIWLCFGTIIVFMLKIFIYKKINYILRFILIYFTIIFTILFLFTILTAASVNRMAHKSYKIFNSIFSSHIHRSKGTLIAKFKVTFSFLPKLNFNI